MVVLAGPTAASIVCQEAKPSLEMFAAMVASFCFDYGRTEDG